MVHLWRAGLPHLPKGIENFFAMVGCSGVSIYEQGLSRKFTVIYASEVPWKRNPNKLAAKTIDFPDTHLRVCEKATAFRSQVFYGDR